MSDAQNLKLKSNEGQKVAFHVFIIAVEEREKRAHAMVFGIPLLIIIILLISTGTCHFQFAYSRIRCL